MPIIIICIVLLLIPVIYNIIFPFRKPNLDGYFSVGQTYSSKEEGLTQTVIKIIENKIYCELRFEPNAIGPIEHLHTTFSESATTIKGTLTTKVGGKLNKVNPGERFFFPKGVYHKMYNETDEIVILRAENDDDFLPVEFAYSLSQIYPLMSPDGGLTFSMFLKICVLDEMFDSLPKGPSPVFFKIIKKVVKPYARLFGAEPYDDKSRPK